MTTDDDLHRPQPRGVAGGRVPFTAPRVRTAASEQMARDIYGKTIDRRPEVFDEIEEHRRWVEAGQPAASEPFQWHYQPGAVRPADAYTIGMASLRDGLRSALEQAIVELNRLRWQQFVDDFDRVLFDGVTTSAPDPPEPPQPGDSRPVLAGKVRAVQQARGVAHGPQRRLRPPRKIDSRRHR